MEAIIQCFIAITVYRALEITVSEILIRRTIKKLKLDIEKKEQEERSGIKWN